MALIYENQEFSSWAEFEKALKEYELKTWASFVVGNSHTVKNANKKIAASGGTNLYKEDLKYQNVIMTCAHGGKKRICTGNGTRPIQSTIKVDCKAFIHLIADRTKLRVDEFHEAHENHELTEENFYSLSRNRRLNSDASEKVKLLFDGGVSPGVIRNLLRETQSGIVTPRDLSNLKRKWKTEKNGKASETDLLIDALENLLKEDPGAVISVSKNEENDELHYLFIQTSNMRENVAKFGRVVMMDHTYKINKNKMPVCVFMVMDGGGSGRSAGYAFVANELLPTVGSVVQSFRNAITEELAVKVKTIIVDKDPSEIGAIQAVFPDAAIQLCSFHVGRVLKEKSKKETKEVKDLINKLRGTTKDNEFNDTVNELEAKASSTFFNYLTDSWLKCPQAWCNRDKIKSINFGNTTTNRVENHNSKIKMVLNCHSTLSESVTKLLELVRNKDEDVLFRDVSENLRETYLTNTNNPDLNQMVKDLKKFAAKLQIWEYNAKTATEEMTYYESTETSCTCLHYWSYEMPCRHIYQSRRQAGSTLHSLKDYEGMWQKSSGPAVPIPQPKKKFCLTSIPAVQAKTGAQKFVLANQVTKEIASMMEYCGSAIFPQRLQVLKQLQKYWAAGTEVQVTPITTDSIPTQNKESNTQEIINVEGESNINTSTDSEIIHNSEDSEKNVECTVEEELEKGFENEPSSSVALSTANNEHDGIVIGLEDIPIMVDGEGNHLYLIQNFGQTQALTENQGGDSISKSLLFEDTSESNGNIFAPEAAVDDISSDSENSESNRNIFAPEAAADDILPDSENSESNRNIFTPEAAADDNLPDSENEPLVGKDLPGNLVLSSPAHGNKFFRLTENKGNQFLNVIDILSDHDTDVDDAVPVIESPGEQLLCSEPLSLNHQITQGDDGSSKDSDLSHLLDDGADLLTGLVDCMNSPEIQQAPSLSQIETEPRIADIVPPPPYCFCGVPAVRRQARNSNKQFYGCPNFFSTKKCSFHRFTKSINTDERSNLREAMRGIKPPAAVKCKGRPKGLGKTSQIKLSQGSKDKVSITKPAGAYITPFQTRQIRGESITDSDVTMNEDGSYTVVSQSNKAISYKVTETSCTCLDRAEVCKHIYKIKQLQKEESSVVVTRALIQNTGACCICQQGEPDHHCDECLKPVHAIDLCSLPLKDGEEGYGKPRKCLSCKANLSANLNVRKRGRNNLANINLDEIQECPSQKKTKTGTLSSQSQPASQSSYGRKITPKIRYTPSKPNKPKQ